MQQILLLALAASAVMVCFGADDTKAWNYVGDDKDEGPSSWSKNFPECAKMRNSPINLPTTKSDLYGEDAATWDLTNWNVEHEWTVLDTHYAVKLSLEDGQTMTTEGGGLEGKYEVLQYHFHWGANDKKGSEHTLGGKMFPMEVHFVHKSSKFATINDAVASGDSDALAVLGFFFELQDEDNAALDGMVDAAIAVRNDSDFKIMGEKVNVHDFVGDALKGSYYRYFGGLTTPGCQQIVEWTVFNTPIGISAKQVEAFRTQKDNSIGVDFFREVQPLGSRTITLYDVNYSPKDYINGGSFNTALCSITFLSLLITKFL